MKDKILQLIAEQFNRNVEDLEPSLSFVYDLGADSIELVELVMNIEEEFDMEIPDDKLQKFQTIQDVLNYIDELK